MSPFVLGPVLGTPNWPSSWWLCWALEVTQADLGTELPADLTHGFIYIFKKRLIHVYFSEAQSNKLLNKRKSFTVSLPANLSPLKSQEGFVFLLPRAGILKPFPGRPHLI
jgi:hypothetical protein